MSNSEGSDASPGWLFGSRKRATFLALLAIGQLVGLFLIAERPAQAYIDPGSGLFTVQIIGASIAGGFFFLRHKLLNLFARRSKAGLPLQEMTSPGKFAEPKIEITPKGTRNP